MMLQGSSAAPAEIIFQLPPGKHKLNQSHIEVHKI